MVKAKLRRIGNSYGFLLPKNEIKDRNLKEGQEVMLDIKDNEQEMLKQLRQAIKNNPKLKKELRL